MQLHAVWQHYSKEYISLNVDFGLVAAPFLCQIALSRLHSSLWGSSIRAAPTVIEIMCPLACWDASKQGRTFGNTRRDF